MKKTDDVYQNKMNETMMEDKEMQILKDRIRKDGKIREGNVLKVDSFLNHQMDVSLFREIGKEFKRRFEGEEITKILTIEHPVSVLPVLLPKFSTFRLSLQKDADQKYRRRCLYHTGGVLYSRKNLRHHRFQGVSRTG